jgi:hypothetical protein
MVSNKAIAETQILGVNTKGNDSQLAREACRASKQQHHLLMMPGIYYLSIVFFMGASAIIGRRQQHLLKENPTSTPGAHWFVLH